MTFHDTPCHLSPLPCFLLTEHMLQARADIFAVHTRRTPLAQDVDIQQLATRTAGYVLCLLHQ